MSTAGLAAAAKAASKAARPARPESWASVTLPIFVFDCTGSILTNELLIKTYAGAGAEKSDNGHKVGHGSIERALFEPNICHS